jgi:excisionase family DNA binding protein
MSDTEDRWLSIEEICRHLGISKDTAYRWIDKNKMPAHRVGRLWKFKKQEVDEWVRNGGSADRPDRHDE